MSPRIGEEKIMTAILDRPETSHVIGAAELVPLVREGMAAHENNAGNGIAYNRSVPRRDVTVARQAFAENAELSGVEREGMGAEFSIPKGASHADVWLGAELASVLFESLNRFAARKSVCDAKQHGGYAGGMCDCQLRRAARRWAADIVLRATGVDVAE